MERITMIYHHDNVSVPSVALFGHTYVHSGGLYNEITFSNTLKEEGTCSAKTTHFFPKGHETEILPPKEGGIFNAKDQLFF